MIEAFIKSYAELIVANPEKLEVFIGETNEQGAEIIVKADSSDVGKLIGKNGNMINALKTLINGCKAKNGQSYKIQVLSLD